MSSLCWSLPHLLSSSPPQHEAPPGQHDLLQDDIVHRAPLPQPIQSTSSADEPLSHVNHESGGNPRNTSPTIPEGTIIGPVLEVHTAKILDGFGIEVVIPSMANPMDTSHVGISRETKRFVNEIHDHKEELRSSNELLADFQGSGRSEFYEEEG